jgi:epoxyqueuosine reductase
MPNFDSYRLKEEAVKLGFSFCGISKAVELTDDAYRLEQWLKAGRHGEMSYMEKHFDKRIDPTKLVDGAKSVISLLYNYYPEKEQAVDSYKISKYAYGNDYHDVLKVKLNQLLAIVREQVGDLHGRCFVDSAPVLERTWAHRSGAGWVGKNGNLITKNQGSFFFLAEIICDITFDYDTPISKNYCGTCTACIDNCPTQAILPNSEIDGSRCISYFTIELKNSIPAEMQGKYTDWIFGCDICQDVCPWNRFSKPQQDPALGANEPLLSLKRSDWAEITEDVFKVLLSNSPMKRTKYRGLKRNIAFLGDQPG